MSKKIPNLPAFEGSKEAQEFYAKKNSWQSAGEERRLDDAALNYYLPLAAPAKVVHEFDGENHLGMDLAAPFGGEIKAMTDGLVEEIASDANGIKVSVRHLDGTDNLSVYSHLSALADGVEVGSYVSQDIAIGASGKTANGSERLHLELVSAGQHVNPRAALRFYPKSDLSRMIAAADGAQKIGGANWDEQLVGNAGPLELSGGGGNDGYYVKFEPTGNRYSVVDTDGEIKIATAGGYFTLAGNAQPKTDSVGEIIDGKWTLSQGFDLERNGTSLVIYHAGSNPEKPQTSLIEIKDYPFGQQQEAFGFTLGKTLLGAGYDSKTETLTEQRTYLGGPLLKSSDNNSFYAVLRQDTTGVSSGFRFVVGKIGSNGVLTEQVDINNDFPITQAGAPVRYTDPSTGKESLAIPFTSRFSEGSLTQTKVGICVVNGDGVQTSQIIESASSADGKTLSQASFRVQPTGDYFELAYQTQSGRVMQKVLISNLEKDGAAAATDTTRVNFETSAALEFADGNKVALTSGVLVVDSPELRDQTGTEIIPNYVVSSGKHSASEIDQESIITIDPSLEQGDLELTVPYNHNSTLVLMADAAFKSGRNFTVKLPVDDLSEAFIYSTNLTAEQIFNGEFEIPASRRKLTKEEEKAALAKNGPEAMKVWERALADSNDDYTLDSDDITLQDATLQSTVIVLPNNQKVVLVGSNATEIEQSLSKYFAVQDQIVLTAQPSGQPSGIPSGEPSGVPSEEPSVIPTMSPNPDPTGEPSHIPNPLPTHGPSGQPNRAPMYTWDPTGQPTFKPVGHPSSLPTGTPTYYLFESPSGQPTAIPTRLPSGEPTSLPTKTPSAQPSGKPTYKPSNYPTSQPSGLPSPMPSYTPTAIPNPDPSGQPSYIPILQPNAWPSGQPTGMPTRYTFNPSRKPSYQPTSGPTSEPTFYLFCNPTTDPTEITAIPTSLPNGEPTSFPSVCPSSDPTKKPTYTPSNYPTQMPIGRPSGAPSSAPIAQPTGIPSGGPTQRPSLRLTARPNPRPTGIPSFIPIAIPSHQPSGEPTERQLFTRNPSGQPTFLPVDPSAAPTGEPTYIITCDPTTSPTKIIALPSTTPSGAPTSYPSMSMDPNEEPSYTPSNHPSCQPSGVPSLAQNNRAPSGTPSLDEPNSKSPSGIPSLASQPSSLPTSGSTNKALTGTGVSESPWTWGKPLAAVAGSVLLITTALAYWFKKKSGSTPIAPDPRDVALDATERGAGRPPLTEINVNLPGGTIDVSALDEERAAARAAATKYVGEVISHAVVGVSSAQGSIGAAVENVLNASKEKTPQSPNRNIEEVLNRPLSTVSSAAHLEPLDRSIQDRALKTKPTAHEDKTRKPKTKISKQKVIPQSQNPNRDGTDGPNL
ncbi:MAG: peptidoglycan DD-metalloendopeptidase family protein [Rickettsiales bacterium]|nr:peptidoglycan DD-metalloendopeptidase family protein [Rickettsiales bacterium]